MRQIGSRKKDMVWPIVKNQNLKTIFENTFQHYASISSFFLGIISEGMGLSHNEFNYLIDDLITPPDDQISSSMLRFHRYSLKLAPSRFRFRNRFFHWEGFPPHADIGLVTIAPRSSLPGLEVRVLDSPHEWINIEKDLQPNDMILFTGQQMSQLTRGLYRPLLHRPVPPAENEWRFSAVFFLRARNDKIIKKEGEEPIQIGHIERDVNLERSLLKLNFTPARMFYYYTNLQYKLNHYRERV